MQIAAPWWPDLVAEAYDRQADNDRKCRTMCEYYMGCDVREWYSGECRLWRDDEPQA